MLPAVACTLVAAAATLLPGTGAFWTPVEGPQLQPVQRKVAAHLVGSGDRVAVYQEDGYRFSLLGEEDEQRQIRGAIQTFDQTIFPREVGLFGPCPDKDGNGKVIVLLTHLSRSHVVFFPFDEMAESDAVRYGFHSNQGEVLYLAFDEQGNRAGWNVQALAEGFQRLLHYARDPGETAWSALLGNYMPYLCGLGPTRLLWGDFDPDGALHSPADPWGARGWSLLFLDYLRDKLGDEGLRDLVASPAKGLGGVSRLLADSGKGMTADDLLADFAMACWLDDPTVADARFSFAHVAPPRPRPVATMVASRPASGAVEVGVGGMVFFLIEGNGERTIPLTLQGDTSIRWVGRAVLLRRRGPDEELHIAFSATGLARLELPALQPGDQVVVAVMAVPGDTAGFDRRSLLLRWGLAWVPRAPEDSSGELLHALLKKALPDAGASAMARLSTTLDRLAGGSAAGGDQPVVRTRYAWAPESAAVIEVLRQEAERRGLEVREQKFLRRAPNDIEQEWTNLLIDLPGSDARRWPVVLAAHWDGARSDLQDSYLRALNLDDNASGVAVALEAAAALTRMPHRAPILIAFLDGGYQDAAGAHALFDELHGAVTAWIELDGVGVPGGWPRTPNVYLEGKNKSLRLPFRLLQPFKRVGLVAKPEEEIAAPHCGASLVASHDMPALVLCARAQDDRLNDLDIPRAVERTWISPAYMALLTKAVASMVVDFAGRPR